MLQSCGGWRRLIRPTGLFKKEKGRSKWIDSPLQGLKYEFVDGEKDIIKGGGQLNEV